MRGILRLAEELTVSEGDLSFTDSVNITHVFQVLVGFQTFYWLNKDPLQKTFS